MLSNLNFIANRNCFQIGIKQVQRVPAPNDHPLFINALSNIVKSHLESKIKLGPKFLNLCPHCTNSNCFQSKEWYKKVCYKR